MDPLVGREIAGHQILQRTATGRLCSTYKASHTAMNRLVAFKALSPDADQNTVEKFHQTARHAAQLHHPNIASLYDVNTEGGVHFCTMEYIEGQTLGELLHARQKIPTTDAIRVAIHVAEALHFANSRKVPGWRLSANRVIISKRGEVKVLSPTFGRAGAPVLDDSYVLPAVGLLLYAMLTGGRVRDIEWALEPGSSARQQLKPLRSVAPGVRRDIAQAIERLMGIAGEPFPNLDAALHTLRGLLAAQEQLETRTRRLSESARVRVQRMRQALYIGVGLVALVAVIVLIVAVARSSASGRAERRFAAAARVAEAALVAFKGAQGKFRAAPSEALAQQVAGHLEEARAAFASVASDFSDHPKGLEAAEYARSYAEELRQFQEIARAEIRYAAAKVKIREVTQAFEREVAMRLERGGQIDLPAWHKRYLAVAKEFAGSAPTAQTIQVILRRLPAEVQMAQMKIDTNAVANEVKEKYLPKNHYGKAIEAWNAYRRRYGKHDNDSLRKQAIQNHEAKMTEVRQAARLKWLELNQQAKFHVGKQEYDKARAIYNRVIEDFGILEYSDRAKEELAKLPKS